MNTRLSEILTLEPGWYNGEGESYSKEALVFAQSILDRLELEPRIYPDPEGSKLSFEWSFTNHEVGLSLDLDSKVGDLVVVDFRTREFKSIELSDLNSPEDIARVNEILRSSS